MANTTLGAESVSANPTNRSLYNAYRHAKAAWDIVLYAPEYEDEDVPAEIDVPLSKSHDEALDRYLRAPVDSVAQLWRKLDIFREEEAWSHDSVAIYVATLAEDARRLIP